MKIRISNNSIRFRLKEPEVHQFNKEQILTEVLELGLSPVEQLKFSLEITSNTNFSIRYQINQTTLFIPEAVAKEWANTGAVGFEEKIDLGNGKTIKVLVEKDFVCADPPDAENKGAYPNLKTNC